MCKVITVTTCPYFTTCWPCVLSEMRLMTNTGVLQLHKWDSWYIQVEGSVLRGHWVQHTFHKRAGPYEIKDNASVWIHKVFNRQYFTENLSCPPTSTTTTTITTLLVKLAVPPWLLKRGGLDSFINNNSFISTSFEDY